MNALIRIPGYVRRAWRLIEAWRADRRLARVDPELHAAKVQIARQRRQHRSTRAAEAQLRAMVTERLARGVRHG